MRSIEGRGTVGDGAVQSKRLLLSSSDGAAHAARVPGCRLRWPGPGPGALGSLGFMTPVSAGGLALHEVV